MVGYCDRIGENKFSKAQMTNCQLHLLVVSVLLHLRTPALGLRMPTHAYALIYVRLRLRSCLFTFTA